MLMQLAHWQPDRGPLIAFLVALGLAAAGRFLKVGLLAAAAGGAGIVAGWYVITGRFWSVPPASVGQLTQIAAIALVIGLVCTWRGVSWMSTLGAVLVALATGWLLAGEPRSQFAIRASWPIGLGVVIAVLLFIRILGDRALDPIRLALAAFTLAAALYVTGASPVWLQLALVPGLAALATLALPPMSEAAGLPVAGDIAALVCLIVIALGRLPRLGFGGADAAALSPLLATWLSPHMTSRLRFAGRLAPLTGSLLAGAIAVGCVWVVRRALGH